MLKLSENKHYMLDEQNRPFFWLGDTAWELLHRLTKEEMLLYLDNRQTKGFNLIQTVILAELDGINTPNAYGEKPLIDNNPEKLNEKYFELVDFFLDECEKRGMYVGLLPSWGDKIVLKWGQGPLIFTPENAYNFGRLLAERYKNRDNIVWINGGDRIPEAPEHVPIFNALARGIRDIDSTHLMSFHPLGTHIASDYFNEPWLDFDMFQSGHDNSIKEYEFVERCLNREPIRPIINGEARYENIGNAFWTEKASDKWLDEFDVRISAWWSILAGAAGYTYGCNDVWQMYETGRKPIIKARTDWQEAIHLPGSRQMGMMKDFFTALPWQDLRHEPSILKQNRENDSLYTICAVTENKEILVAYIPEGGSIEVDLAMMAPEKVRCCWYNPRSGRYREIGEYSTDKIESFTPWANGRGSDFVLLIRGVS